MLGTTQRASLVDAVFAGAMTGHGAEINDFIPSVFVQPGPAIVATVLGLAERPGPVGRRRGPGRPRRLRARGPHPPGARHRQPPRRRPRQPRHRARVRGGRRRGHVARAARRARRRRARRAAPSRHRARGSGCTTSSTSRSRSCSPAWAPATACRRRCWSRPGSGASRTASTIRPAGSGPRAFRAGDRDPDALTAGLDRTAGACTTRRTSATRSAGRRSRRSRHCSTWSTRSTAATSPASRSPCPGGRTRSADAAMPALNLRYLAAIILIDGHLDFVAAQSLDRLRHDEEVAARMATVEVVHDPAQEAGSGRARAESARVTVTLRSGAVVERFVGSVPGFPTHPMGRAEVEAKARDLHDPPPGQQPGREDRARLPAARRPRTGRRPRRPDRPLTTRPGLPPPADHDRPTTTDPTTDRSDHDDPRGRDHRWTSAKRPATTRSSSDASTLDVDGDRRARHPLAARGHVRAAPDRVHRPRRLPAQARRQRPRAGPATGHQPRRRVWSRSTRPGTATASPIRPPPPGALAAARTRAPGAGVSTTKALAALAKRAAAARRRVARAPRRPPGRRAVGRGTVRLVGSVDGDDPRPAARRRGRADRRGRLRPERAADRATSGRPRRLLRSPSPCCSSTSGTTSS